MMKKKLKRTVIISLFSIISVLYILYFYILPIKPLESFQNRPYSVQFFDQNGKLLQVTGLENGLRREFTDFSKIPPTLRNAFLHTEDKRFYFHNGIDFIAIIRAFFQNISGKRTVSGASTISMQLSKMIYGNQERTGSNKIKEIVLALRIEKRFSKNKLLEYYLNNIPFGNNVEGITSAARYYFSKDLCALDKEEIMLLAVIPRRPELYNPLKNPLQCSKQAALIFNYSEKKLIEKSQKLTSRYEWPFEFPHLIEKAKKSLKKGTTKCILTTDKELQNFAEFSLSTALKDSSKSRINNGAVIVIDNKSGKILSWVGSNSWFDKGHSGEIDGVTVRNQMGSSMKPFLYAAALETQSSLTSEKTLFRPNMILKDIPMDFGSDSLYFPRNFNNRYNGPVLFRTSLASSLNVPAVYILNEITVPHYLNVLDSLGFDSLKKDGIKNNLGLALGSGEVTLLELTSAFAVFPRDGIYIKPFFIEEKNKIMHKVYEKDTARLICDILSDKKARVTGFGYFQTFETQYPSIFKTGTANQFQNIVALGATPDYTVGVWMGNFDGNTVIGKTGSSLPAKVAKEILDYLTEDESKPFLPPENFVKMKICPLSAMSPDENCPRTVEEFVKITDAERFKNEKCVWHQKDLNGNIKTIYPAEFENFISDNFINSHADHSSSSLKIASPADGSIFYLDEKNSEAQKIPVNITGGFSSDDKLKIFYDEKELNTDSDELYSSLILLPVEKGEHHIKVILENETDEIYFEVK